MLIENEPKRKRTLLMLQESMNDAGIPNKFVVKGDQDSPFDILIANHNLLPDFSFVGQYFFPEYDAAENVCYFSAMMTIMEEIPEDRLEEIKKKTEEANQKIVCGMFTIYPEVGLVYKLTVPVSETLEDNDLFSTIDIASAHAIALSTAFAAEELL